MYIHTKYVFLDSQHLKYIYIYCLIFFNNYMYLNKRKERKKENKTKRKLMACDVNRMKYEVQDVKRKSTKLLPLSHL